MTHIVVLDGRTLNPGDLSWDGFRAFGDVDLYESTPPELVVQHSADAEIILTNKVVIDAATIDQLPKLRLIAVTATGYDIIDVDGAAERGIPVCNVPTYGTQSVAQMVYAHLLEFTQHVAHHVQTVKEGQWSESEDFCYWDYPLIELMDLTMGIVGYGRIGRNVAALAVAFGMKVLAYDAFVQNSGDPNVTMTDLGTLFSRSDVVTLHTPLTPETEDLVDARLLGKMKKTAFLINTSRGPVINEADLLVALREGWIAGAGLDVLEVEPPAKDNPLFALDNCHVTPHISWATRSARARLMQTTVDNVAAFLAGRPQNVVNYSR